jgi:lipopolysaccharide/colanic/teichoic acid biosynthesis glycosyltransferase
MNLLLRCGLRHHARRPLPSLLTLLGIAAGVALLVAMQSAQRTAERAFDLAVAIPATIALAPVMAGLAAWVRIDSPGPAVFRQRRAGAFGRS